MLSSGKLTRDILHEIVHFIEANDPFIGVESFLMILMPFEICIDYLIETQPDYLLNYAICAINDDQKWQQLLIRITMQCKRITQNRSQEFYETLLKGMSVVDSTKLLISTIISLIFLLYLMNRSFGLFGAHKTFT